MSKRVRDLGGDLGSSLWWARWGGRFGVAESWIDWVEREVVWVSVCGCVVVLH